MKRDLIYLTLIVAAICGRTRYGEGRAPDGPAADPNP